MADKVARNSWGLRDGRFDRKPLWDKMEIDENRSIIQHACYFQPWKIIMKSRTWFAFGLSMFVCCVIVVCYTLKYIHMYITCITRINEWQVPLRRSWELFSVLEQMSDKFLWGDHVNYFLCWNISQEQMSHKTLCGDRVNYFLSRNMSQIQMSYKSLWGDHTNYFLSRNMLWVWSRSEISPPQTMKMVSSEGLQPLICRFLNKLLDFY